VPKFNVTPENTALLILDLQRLNIDESGGISRLAKVKGVTSEFKDYFLLTHRMVLNTKSILERCRKLGFTVIFTRIVSNTGNGSDIGRNASIWDTDFPYDPKDEKLIFSPKEGEIVFNKTCYNPFNCTNLESTLRNRNIQYLILSGVRSPGYLDITAYDAADKGFGVLVVSDAVAGGVLNNTSNMTGGLLRIRSSRLVHELLDTIEGAVQ
jgi:nicotinamidase-related amidase